jgi:hypothetical protein
MMAWLRGKVMGLVVLAVALVLVMAPQTRAQMHRLMNPLLEGVFTHFGLYAHTGNVVRVGNVTQTGDIALTGALTVNGAAPVMETDVLAAVTLTATDLTNGTGSVSIQIVDGAGTEVASRELVTAWVSTAAYGAPATNNIESLTVSTGTSVQVILAAGAVEVLTDTNGVALLTLDYTADGTNYVQAAVGAKVASTALAVTGNE